MKKILLKSKINKLIRSHFNLGKKNQFLSANKIRQWDSLGHLTLISKDISAEGQREMALLLNPWSSGNAAQLFSCVDTLT